MNKISLKRGQEVWVKAIVVNNEPDFQGYTHLKSKNNWQFKLKLEDIVTEIPKKPIVPQFVAEWYEEHKGSLEYNLYLYQMSIYEEEVEKDNFYYWMQKSNNPIRTLVNMHQFGYTIKK